MAEMNFNEWYEPTPADWSIQRMKNIMVPRDERSAYGEEELLSVTIHGGVIKRSEYIDEDEGTSRADSLVGYKIVSPTNLVNNIMKMSFRCLGVSAHEGIVSPAYSVFELNQSKVDHSYLNFLLRIDRYVAEYRKLSKGIQESRMRLYDDFFLAMKVIVPPLDEQKRISHYLDKKISQIDLLINKIEKKIKLLKEQRFSLIKHYVTKGLNSNEEMKESGVEWIGKVPKHWSIRRIKHIGNIKSGDGFKVELQGNSSGEIPFYKVSDTNIEGNEKYLSTSNNYLSKFEVTENRIRIFPKNTILFPKIGAVLKLNKRRIAQCACCVDNNMMGVTIESNDLPEFVYFFMTIVNFDLYCSDGTIPSISDSQVGRIDFVSPPISEQKMILEILGTKLGTLDKIVSNVIRKKNALIEYRQSLISSLVSGKVRFTEDMV